MMKGFVNGAVSQQNIILVIVYIAVSFGMMILKKIKTDKNLKKQNTIINLCP